MNLVPTHNYISEKSPEKRGERILDKKTKTNSSASELFDRHNPFSAETLQKKNKLSKQVQFIHRVSPFLLLGFFLVGLFPYMFITDKGNVHNIWLLLFLFVFLEVNVLFADFALWNYFQGKKILRIWLIEMPLAFLIIHFLL